MTTYSVHGPTSTTDSDNWRAAAACRDDPDAMFPDNDTVEIADAKAICARCPVVHACLVDALHAEGNKSTKSRFGIYGGLRPVERWRLYDTARRTRAARQTETAAAA